MRDCDFGFSLPAAARSPRHTWECWRLTLPPANASQIGRWLLRCPFAHPVWSQWVVSLVHLRPVGGLPAAVGSGHNLAIFAVDPCHELEPDEPVPPRALLSPPIAFDFDVFGACDWRAVERVELLLECTMRRELSPDDDCRRLWRELLCRPAEVVRSAHA